MAPFIYQHSSSCFDTDIESVSSPLSCSSDKAMVTATFRKLPNSVQSRSTNNHVRFDDKVTTRLVLSRQDYTPEETDLSFYDRNFLKGMKRTANTEARLLEVGMLRESSCMCARGLEGRTREGLRRKRQNRADALSAVFDELDSQDTQGILDDDALADVYYVHSEHCQAAAQMMGMRDAKMANEDDTSDDNFKPDGLHSLPLIPDQNWSLVTSGHLISSAA